MDSSILAAALNYIERGWYVLPLLPGKKNPLGALVNQGFKNASNDPEVIKEWFREYPDANIGIAAGHEFGLLIVDIDNKNGKSGNTTLLELNKRFGGLPPTFIEFTPSGGFHLYYKFPAELFDKPRRAEFVKNGGVDIKSKGYVVAAPSVVDGKRYVISNDAPVASLPQSWINACIRPQSEIPDIIRHEPNGNATICDTHGITLRDVMDIPVGIRRAGGGYICSHMVHGSTGDGNLSINFDKGVFHCFRHDTGGDALVWIAIREGYIDCADAGSLEKEVVLKCVEKLQEDGLIAPTKTRRLLHESAVELEEIL